MSGTETVLPNLCYVCQYAVVHGARFAEHDPWQALIVVVQIGLFQAATGDERVWQRCSTTESGERDASDLSLILAEIGCLGCFKPKTRDALVDAVRDEGLDAVAQRVNTTPTEDLDGSGSTP